LEIILKWSLKNTRAWTGFVWFRVKKNYGLLWARCWTRGLHEMWVIYLFVYSAGCTMFPYLPAPI
jgi:hypothetical protein